MASGIAVASSVFWRTATSMAAAMSPRPSAFQALSNESSASLFAWTSAPRKLPFTVSVTSESAASVITLLYDGRKVFSAIAVFPSERSPAPPANTPRLKCR